jgi:hypothetical protein
MREESGAIQAKYDNIIPRMRIACWKTKATETHSKYVTLTVFPLGKNEERFVNVFGTWCWRRMLKIKK